MTFCDLELVPSCPNNNSPNASHKMRLTTRSNASSPMLASPYQVIFAVAAVFTKIDDLAQVQRGTHPDLGPIRKNGVMQ